MLVAPSGARPHRIPRPPLVPSKIDHALDLVVVGAPKGLHDAPRRHSGLGVVRRNVGTTAENSRMETCISNSQICATEKRNFWCQGVDVT